MPPIIKKTAGGTNYVIPFIGRVDHTIHVQVDLSLRSTDEIDSDGVMKPGVVLPIHGGALGNVSGTAQVETGTLVGAITEPGNIKITVTSRFYPVPLEIPVAVADDDTAAQQGAKVRAALGADTRITDHYTVGGANAEYSLTAKNPDTNDATLNLKHEAVAPTVGLTTANASANTTAGVAPDEAVMVYAATKVAHGNTGLNLITEKPFVTCAVIAVANRYLVEDNLGRPLTAKEVTALKNSRITLRS